MLPEASTKTYDFSVVYLQINSNSLHVKSPPNRSQVMFNVVETSPGAVEA